MRPVWWHKELSEKQRNKTWDLNVKRGDHKKKQPENGKIVQTLKTYFTIFRKAKA